MHPGIRYIPYVWKSRRYIYNTRQPKHAHLPILPCKKTAGTQSTALLHIIRPLTQTHVCLWIRYYVYIFKMPKIAETMTIPTYLARRLWNSPATQAPSSVSPAFNCTHFTIRLILPNSTCDLWFDSHFLIWLSFSDMSWFTRRCL